MANNKNHITSEFKYQTGEFLEGKPNERATKSSAEARLTSSQQNINHSFPQFYLELEAW